MQARKRLLKVWGMTMKRYDVNVLKALPQLGRPEELVGNWGRALAEILYWMPDHPLILQTMIYECADVSPHFPQLRRLFEFWQENLDGKIFAATVTHTKVLVPTEIRAIDAEFKIH
ncbi:hypothetical protein HY970_00555 [Candidatus Kaiserbacteria bacterium]|nr:hypothetical protein [Candidatus Kaiserbacteria bacterium]